MFWGQQMTVATAASLAILEYVNKTPLPTSYQWHLNFPPICIYLCDKNGKAYWTHADPRGTFPEIIEARAFQIEKAVSFIGVFFVLLRRDPAQFGISF